MSGGQRVPSRPSSPHRKPQRARKGAASEGRGPSPPPHAARRAGRATAAGRRALERGWPLAALLALAALGWSCRGALFGVPTADDYDYLYNLTFTRPLDLLGSMGALFYWRPLGRQLYYATLRPVLFAAPWVGTAAHAGLLLLVSWLIYRLARRAFPPGAALAIAAFPLLAEPLRALLVWPTGGEYLLAMGAAALAVHEAADGRHLTAGLAALAALLSHEAAAVVLPAVLLVGWQRERTRRALVRWSGVALAVAVVWVVGRVAAQSHGARWLAPGAGAAGAGRALLRDLAVAGWRSVAAQLNLEDARSLLGSVLLVLYGALALAAVAYALGDRQARARLARHKVVLLGAAAWFAVGVAPLALLLPDWESWRTPLPALWLGVAALGPLALIRGWLAYTFLAVRVAALLLAPVAPGVVEERVPQTTSKMSFARVVRLQRTSDSTRRALLASHPKLRRGAGIYYWTRIPVTEIAMVAPKAMRVWYADSTLTWTWYWDPKLAQRRPDVLLAFDAGSARPAVVLEPRAVALGLESLTAMERGALPRADSLLLRAYDAQSVRPSTQFTAWLVQNRARIAFTAGDYTAAGRLNLRTLELAGGNDEFYAMTAMLALVRNDLPVAREATQRALALDATNTFALRAAEQLGMLRPGAAGAGGVVPGSAAPGSAAPGGGP
jgi:hypothetical protein